MIKVLYLLNHAGKAGTERYVESLIQKMNGNRIQAYFAYNEEGLLVERLQAMGIETHRLVMKHPYDLQAAWNLSKLCKKLAIDLIHTQYLRENYIAMLSRIFNPRVKVMYTSHFILKNNAFVRMSNRLITPLESNVIAVCNKGRETLISNGVNGDKIKVIFNGVDPELWGTAEPSTLRQELGIGGEVFVILCASRFAHDKGHHFLIEAAAELKKLTDRPFKLVLAGDGPLLEDRKKQVQALGLSDDVVFVGFRKDIKNLFNGSDLYVNSSEHEALSFLMLEVLASGLPLIATDMGGNGDIINEQTNCGILVKYEDAPGLAQAIHKVMGNKELQETLRRNAFKAVRDRFDLDNIVDKTYNVYLESVKK